MKDLFWSGFYELVIDPAGRHGDFSGRVRIDNGSGGSISEARIRLVSTEKGVLDASAAQGKDPLSAKASSPLSLRHVYGRDMLAFESQMAGMTALNTYEIPESLSLDRNEQKFIQLYGARQIPVRRFYVYDGVKFDRFQRSRRNDWNYGTESHSTVEAHLEFENSESGGLGVDLAPGQLRLYERNADGTLDLLGEDFLNGTPKGSDGHVQLGVARGLRGERERTGYSEVVPLHTYEETFEIRLENNSESDAEIRVVEHLYRWHDFEVVRADAEYTKTGPQVIEFRPKLKPGGRRALHYTVRYNW